MIYMRIGRMVVKSHKEEMTPINMNPLQGEPEYRYAECVQKLTAVGRSGALGCE